MTPATYEKGLILFRFTPALSASLLILAGFSEATPIFDPGAFASPTVIDYRNSPVGVLPNSTAVTTQYAALGVLHNGQTTTPPGPTGISSLSGLPALEASPDSARFTNLIRLDFTVPVREVGAFFITSAANASITLAAFGVGDVALESVTVLPADMPLRPGPFGFNEGFVGLSLNDDVAYATFRTSQGAYAIDDLHFSPVPEPSSAGLATVGVGLLLGVRFASAQARRFAKLIGFAWRPILVPLSKP